MRPKWSTRCGTRAMPTNGHLRRYTAVLSLSPLPLSGPGPCAMGGGGNNITVILMTNFSPQQRPIDDASKKKTTKPRTINFTPGVSNSIRKACSAMQFEKKKKEIPDAYAHGEPPLALTPKRRAKQSSRLYKSQICPSVTFISILQSGYFISGASPDSPPARPSRSA